MKFFSSDLVTKVKKVPVSGEDRREISKDRRREDSEPKIKLILLVAGRGAPVPEVNARPAFLLFAERLAPTHKLLLLLLLLRYAQGTPAPRPCVWR